MNPLVILGGLASAAAAAFLANLLIDRRRLRRQRHDEEIMWEAGFVYGDEHYRTSLPSPAYPPDFPVFNPRASRARRRQVARDARMAAFATGVFDGFWSAARADLTPAGISKLVKECA